MSCSTVYTIRCGNYSLDLINISYFIKMRVLNFALWKLDNTEQVTSLRIKGRPNWREGQRPQIRSSKLYVVFLKTDLNSLSLETVSPRIKWLQVSTNLVQLSWRFRVFLSTIVVIFMQLHFINTFVRVALPPGLAGTIELFLRWKWSSNWIMSDP